MKRFLINVWSIIFITSIFCINTEILFAIEKIECGKIDNYKQWISLKSSVNGLNDNFFSATGNIFLSVDGAGSHSSQYKVKIYKPDNAAKVRKAFLMATSTGNTLHKITNSDLYIEGKSFTWTSQVNGTMQNYNARADVTSIIKPIVDDRTKGNIEISVREKDSKVIEGVALAVIFDNSQQFFERSIFLIFGAQKMSGDSFSIKLKNKYDDQTSYANMGLGISFSFQGPKNVQYSIIEVNGKRLSSAAGGHDDGSSGNGALITVGGIGDSINNPPNPNYTSENYRYDDELYSLLPFLKENDTLISVYTKNPSNDDNIFFAYFDLPPAHEEIFAKYVDHTTLPDINNNTFPEIASLLINSSNGENFVYIKDTETNEIINKISFLDDNWTPVSISYIEDINNNNFPEISVLGINKTSQQTRVQIKDSKTGKIVNNISFPSN